MKRTLGILLTFMMIFLLESCSRNSEWKRGSLSEWMVPNKKVKVLTTIAMIEDLVQRVGGDKVDTITLVQGELDPHSYQIVKGDDEKLAFAQVIFYNGLGLEHGASLREYLQSSSKAVALGNKIYDDQPYLFLQYDGQIDPHIWMDVSMWLKVIPHIVDTLSKADPENRNYYRTNGEMLEDEIIITHNQIREILSSIPEKKRYLVTSHDAFNYFARAYMASKEEATQEQWQTRFSAPEGLAPESQLSSTDIKRVLDHIAKFKIETIFFESNVNQDSLRKLVDAGTEKGLPLKIATVPLYGDAMGNEGSGADSYQKMMLHNAHTIKEYLGKDNDKK